jgi:integrase
MLYTGLRIGDVVSFDVSKRLEGNNIFLRMHKTRKQVFSWIPEWLVERIRAREARLGPLIFRVGRTDSLERQTQVWRNRLGKIFDLSGEFAEPPVPHRLRHTFVRILLEKGIPVGDVAELIGDTEQVLLRYYAKWISSRQDRLSKILQDAFEDKPTPKLVSIR